MLKQEIIEKITKYFKLTHYDAEKIYDDIFQSIMKGVKDDNIAEISNLGEFILKYNENENSGFKKTVEFLPSANLEDEVGGVHEIKQDIEKENVTEEKIQDIKSEIEPVIEPEKTVEEITPGKIEEEKPSMKEPIVQTTEKKDEPVSKSPEITEE
ncbi:MAG TPA: HU family DNA-binding protein, partial [Ignavibacteria bacterium]|nr:HU family DNA-binding protein [Ignavibacteria bacterium]